MIVGSLAGWLDAGGGTTSVASAGGWLDAGGGAIPKSVTFGRTIVSLPVGMRGSLSAGGATDFGSRRAPQFPQKRSSSLTSLWQFGHCAMWLPPIVWL
jgi:hypothetical protein